MLSKLTKQKTVNSKKAALYYLNTFCFPTDTTLVLHNTPNSRGLKFFPRIIILPIMMNWESGVNDASSVTALLLL